MHKPRISLDGPGFTLGCLLSTMPEVTATAEEAYRPVLEDHARVVGKVIEVATVYLWGERSVYREFDAKPGQPFAARVLPTGEDGLQHLMSVYLDPYWNLDVLDGRGVIPPRMLRNSHPWTIGRSVQIEN